MIKYRAYQVNPEYQESPFHDTYYYHIFIDGGKHFVGYKKKELDDLKNLFIDCAEDFKLNDNKVREAVIEQFYVLQENKYEMESFIHWLENYNEENEDDFLMGLHYSFGGEWVCEEIHGVCQGDWAIIYFDCEEYNSESIKQIEADYFNLGTDWRIEDAENEDDNYYCYCYAWDDEALKQELANNADCAINEIAVYKWNGYIKTPKYKEI